MAAYKEQALTELREKVLKESLKTEGRYLSSFLLLTF